MIKALNISIIGAGRVGWHLAQALSAAGHQVQQVWSRKHSHARQLADKLPGSTVASSLDFSASTSQLFLLSVTDTAIEEVCRRMLLPKVAILAHTSGSQPLEMLQNAAARFGVFYPLQTFSKEKKVAIAKVPFFIEGSDDATTLLLESLAGSLSDQVHRTSAEQRRQLHLAAVFACNFSNHMLRIGYELLKESQLPENILQPLIEETLQKALSIGPAPAQTGPAIRNDKPVMELHQKQLFLHPEWLKLYTLISEDIRRNNP